MPVDEKTIIEMEERLVERINQLQQEKDALVDQLIAARQEFSNALETVQNERVAALNSAKSDLQDQITSVVNGAKAELNRSIANTVDTAKSQMTRDIAEGNIIAQKAAMLRARDNSHWMRFSETDSQNRDVFRLWSNDNREHDLIKVPFSREAGDAKALYSRSKTFYLVVQDDGNTVLHRSSDHNPLWSSSLSRAYNVPVSPQAPNSPGRGNRPGGRRTRGN